MQSLPGIRPAQSTQRRAVLWVQFEYLHKFTDRLIVSARIKAIEAEQVLANS